MGISTRKRLPPEEFKLPVITRVRTNREAFPGASTRPPAASEPLASSSDGMAAPIIGAALIVHAFGAAGGDYAVPEREAPGEDYSSSYDSGSPGFGSSDW